MKQAAAVGLALILTLGGSLQADDKPRAIVERAIQALGGKDKILLPHGRVLKFKGNIESKDQLGQAGIPVAGESCTQPGTGYRLDFKLMVAGLERAVVVLHTETEHWRVINGQWNKLSEAEVAYYRSVRYVDQVTDLVPLLRDKEFQLELLPETEVETKKAVGIKVTREGKPEVQLSFEKETGLLCRIYYKLLDPNTEKEETHELILSGYKEVDWSAQAEEPLKQAGLATGPRELLELVRKRSWTAEQSKQVRTLIGQLADDSFEVREQAEKDLVKLGPVAIAALEKASQDDDQEVARRARDSLKVIQDQHNPTTLQAAIRVLGLRRPAGALETLLDFLPRAEPAAAEEIRIALLNFAEAPGSPPAALVKALEDSNPLRREAARAALGKDDGAWLKKPSRPVFPTGIKSAHKHTLRKGNGQMVTLEYFHTQMYNRLEDKLFARPEE